MTELEKLEQEFDKLEHIASFTSITDWMNLAREMLEALRKRGVGKQESYPMAVVGNLDIGFMFIGPFDTEEAAEGYCGDNPEATVHELIDPDEAP